MSEQSTADCAELIELMRAHEAMRDSSTWPRPEGRPYRVLNGLAAAPIFAHALLSSKRERATFGQLNMPFGKFTLMTREFDQYGRVRSINFLQFEDAHAHWNIDVDVNDGATFRFTRRWNGLSGGHRVANRD